jgi:hypothetical protein
MTSNLTVRMPSVSTAGTSCGTRAETFLSRAKALYEGNLKAAPAKGHERAIRRKLDGSLNLSIHEGAEILRRADDPSAVDLLRAYAIDGGKGHCIHIALVSSPCVEQSDVTVIERDIFMTVSRFMPEVDAALHAPKTCRELRRLREMEIGIEARMNALLCAAEGSYDQG